MDEICLSASFFVFDFFLNRVFNYKKSTGPYPMQSKSMIFFYSCLHTSSMMKQIDRQEKANLSTPRHKYIHIYRLVIIFKENKVDSYLTLSFGIKL